MHRGIHTITGMVICIRMKDLTWEKSSVNARALSAPHCMRLADQHTEHVRRDLKDHQGAMYPDITNNSG